jgi:hypothetical protein
LDKRPVYPGSIPLDLDLLTPQRNTEIALGFIMQAAFGTNTVIDGLAVVPTGPASMQVKVGPGSIIFATTVDTLTSGFGSLPVDNADSLVKIGINLTSTTMSALTPPAVAGQSQNWLVECQFIEADGSPVVLPYYNAANPSQPYSGPANAGTTNNTARTNRVQLQWKGGTAATTGTQNTPSPDAGWTGVAIVTVANGQSTITSSSITPYSLAPYVPTKLPLQRMKLQANLNVYVATTGSDTANSGLSASSPFLTLQNAWNYIIANLDLNGFVVTVNVANGTYSSGLLAIGSPVGATQNGVTFVGNSGSPSSVIISTSNRHAIKAGLNTSISVGGMTVTATGTDPDGQLACGIMSQGFSNVTISAPMVFGLCAGNHMLALNLSKIFASGVNYSVTGNAAQSHWQASLGSQINVQSCTITLTSSPLVSQGWAQATMNSNLTLTSLTFSGSANAAVVRYTVTTNSVVNTGTGSATYLPGGVAGTPATGGQYL